MVTPASARRLSSVLTQEPGRSPEALGAIGNPARYGSASPLLAFHFGVLA